MVLEGTLVGRVSDQKTQTTRVFFLAGKNCNDGRAVRNSPGWRAAHDFAMEAARLIKSKNPHSMVEVKHLQSGDVAAVPLRPG
jgi:hypothetical protein